MRRAIPGLLLAACASSDPAPATVEQPGKIVAEASLDVARAVEARAPPPALLLELRAKGALPSRLANDLRTGRGWLRVEGPRGLSFAGKAILAGEGPFRPSAASLLFVQPREGGAGAAEPALFRLGGSVDANAIRSRIETVAAQVGDGDDELARIESADLRVLLGHGLDVLLSCVGSGEIDTHHWIRVVDAEGNPAAWREALDAARADRSLGPIESCRVLVRRRRPGEPVPVHYRLRLSDVVVAAQSRLVARESTFDWIWEGVWSARLAGPAAEGPLAWPAEAPPLEVRYKEYERPAGGPSGAFWQGLLAPLALGKDIGMAVLGGEPLVDSVAERQRQRN